MNINRSHTQIFAVLSLSLIALTSCHSRQPPDDYVYIGQSNPHVIKHQQDSISAETALDSSSSVLFKDVQKVIKSNHIYHITSTTVGEKQSQVIAMVNDKEVKVVVEDIGNNQSKLYVKDGRGKDHATILLNNIIKTV